MKSSLRAASAMLLASLAAGVGLVGVAGAEAVVPTGGCWTYVPDPLDPSLDAAPAADLSTALEPWSVDGTQILLGTSGATAVGGTRDLVVGISTGPVVSELAALGTAYVVLSIDGVPLAEPLSTGFLAAPGAPVSDVVVRGSVPVDTAGAHTVSVDSVYFDVPAEGRRVACNGQTEGTAGGPNPATDPVPTGIRGEYDAVAASAAAVTKVVGQRVTDSARSGDTVRVRATGLASSVPADVQLCSGDVCDGSVAPMAWVGQDGSATVDVAVPDGLDAGDATVTIGDGTTSVSTSFTVLADPTIAASEKIGDTTTTVTVTGTSWDPGKRVAVAGYAGDDTTAARTDDPVVRAEVDSAGSFTATYEVSDPDTETIGVTQGGALAAGYAFSGTVGAGATDPVDPVDPVEPVDPGVPGAVTPPISDPGVASPGDIPPPGDMPIEVDPGDPTTPVTPEQTEDLTVSEAHLTGQADLAELFGGSPRRDLVFLVENTGDATVDNPIVRVAVGRSEELEPEVVDVSVGTLEPGDQSVVTVPLELPMAAFGTYRIVGQVGDSDAGAFEVDWTTYPWGLFALNVLAAALLAWGVRHRLASRRPAPYRPVPGLAGADDAVVDITAAESWWVYRARGGVLLEPGLNPTGDPAALTVEEVSGEAVVDLDAAEKWWARRGSEKGSQAS